MSDKDKEEKSIISRSPLGDPDDNLERYTAERVSVKEIHAKYSTK